MNDSPPERVYTLRIETPEPDLVSSVALELSSGSGAHIEGEDRVTVFFEASRHGAPAELRATLDRHLEARLAEIPFEAAAPQEVESEDWRETWKEFFEPVSLSDRIRIGPPWETFEAPPGGTALVVEPGMAFGTGHHETTRLCAQLLEDRLRTAPPGTSVLDVGCGSGILSMIAAVCGADEVVGLDIDSEALASARQNLERNDLERPVSLSDRPVGSLDSTFDLVVANILAAELVELRDALWDRVAPQGALLLSGVLTEESDRIRQTFDAGGAEPSLHSENEWCAIVFDPRAR